MSPSTHLSIIGPLRDGAGDEAAWARFATRYRAVLRDWCLHRCRRRSVAGGEEIAEDVAAELVATIRQRLRTYRTEEGTGKGRFRAWLRRVAENALSDWLQRESQPGRRGTGDSWVADLFDGMEAEEGPGEACWMEHCRAVFHEVILPRVQKEVQPERWAAVMELGLEDGRSGEGPGLKEVAERHGVPPTTLAQWKSRLLARLRALREELEEDGTL